MHPASFIEEWQLGNGNKSIALRAWDKTNSKWGFVWISDNGLYQVWDTRKINGQWLIYKSFDLMAKSIYPGRDLFSNRMEPFFESAKKVMMKKIGN